MATILQSLQDIRSEDVTYILREYGGMPRPEYGEACLKARTAAASLRKPTWSIFAMAHVNALLMGLNNIKHSDSYDIIKLLSAVECYSFGIMGQVGLGFEDFNLAIGPIASVLAPELFIYEQTWTQEPVPKIEYVRPAYRATRKTRNKMDFDIDIPGLVDSLVKEAGLQSAAPSTFHAVQSESVSALDAILNSIVKP